MPTPKTDAYKSIDHAPQAKDDAAATTEAKVLTIDVLANDLGGNAKRLYSVDQVDPKHVALTGQSELGASVRIVDGRIVYDPTAAGAIRALAGGETATDTFSYTIQMGNGALSLAVVKVTVTGTNDAPVLAADPVASHPLTELASRTDAGDLQTATATLSFTDADLGDSHSVTIGAPTVVWSGGAAPPAGTLASLQSAVGAAVTEPGASGQGAVTLNFSAQDRAFDFLSVGETLTATYDVTVKDADGAASTRPVTFTVSGANDAPEVEVQGSSRVSITEASGVTGSTAITSETVHLSFTDVDLTDTHTVSIKNSTGSTTVTAEGLHPVPNYIAKFNAAFSAIVTNLPAGGGSVAATVSFADHTFDYLGANDHAGAAFRITVTDNHGKASSEEIYFTVQGANDAPTITAAGATTSGAITEGAPSGPPATASGLVAFADVDWLDTHTVSSAFSSTTGAGQLGVVAASLVTDSTYGAAGEIAWTFTANQAALQSLAAGQTVTETHTVTVRDAFGGVATQDVVVTLGGANDAPAFVGRGERSVVMSELAGVTGSNAVTTGSIDLAFTDVDLADSHTISATARMAFTNVRADLGSSARLPEYESRFTSALSTSLTDSTGDGAGFATATMTFADKTFDYLGAGQFAMVKFGITVTDDHGASVMEDVWFDVRGANDAPTITALGSTVGGAVVEGAQVGATETASGLIRFADVDWTDKHTVSTAFSSNTGGSQLGALTATLVHDSTYGEVGSIAWTYTVNDAALQALSPGQSVTETHTVTVRDIFGGVATQDVTVTLTNPKHVVTFDDVVGPVRAGYGGFNWTTEGPVVGDDGALWSVDPDRDGDREALSLGAHPTTITRVDGSDFDLVSLHLGAAHMSRGAEATSIDIIGFDDGAQKYVRHVSVNQFTLEEIQLEFLDVDTVQIVVTGGYNSASGGVAGMYLVDDWVTRY